MKEALVSFDGSDATTTSPRKAARNRGVDGNIGVRTAGCAGKIGTIVITRKHGKTLKVYLT